MISTAFRLLGERSDKIGPSRQTMQKLAKQMEATKLIVDYPTHRPLAVVLSATRLIFFYLWI
jgi:hypothetical protein